MYLDQDFTTAIPFEINWVCEIILISGVGSIRIRSLRDPDETCEVTRDLRTLLTWMNHFGS